MALQKNQAIFLFLFQAHSTQFQPLRMLCAIYKTQISKADFFHLLCLPRLSVAAQSTSPRSTTGWCLCRAAMSSSRARCGGCGAKACPIPRARPSAATWWWNSRWLSLTGSRHSPARSSSTAWASANRNSLSNLVINSHTALPKVLVSQPITTSYCVWRMASSAFVSSVEGTTSCMSSKFRADEWGLWYLRAFCWFSCLSAVICTVILANLEQDISVLFKSV